MNDLEPRRGHHSLPPRILCLILLAPLLNTCGDATGPIFTFWEGTLVPIRPSFVAGRVVAVTQHGRTDTGISIDWMKPGITYVWRIDSGSCDEDGVIQGGPAAYPLLLPNQSGSASADATISSLFKSGRQFAARVVRSPEGGSSQVVACGNLEESIG